MTGSVSEFERDGDTLAPPPTDTHHDVPPRMSGTEELRVILGQVLDEKLKPFESIHEELGRLRGSLELAVYEFRRKTDAHDAELDALRARVRTLETETSELRNKLIEVEHDLDRILDDGR